MTEPTLPQKIAASWERERPELEQSGLGFAVRIRALAMEIDHVIAATSAEEDVPVDDMLLLFALRRRGPPYSLKPTDMYGLLNVTSGAATYRIERLVKRGIAERVDDPDDRRGYLLRISAEGMRVIDRAVDALAAAGRSALAAAGFDPVHLAALDSTLGQLERGWEAIIDPVDNPLARRERSLIGRRPGR